MWNVEPVTSPPIRIRPPGVVRVHSRSTVKLKSTSYMVIVPWTLEPSPVASSSTVAPLFLKVPRASSVAVAVDAGVDVGPTDGVGVATGTVLEVGAAVGPAPVQPVRMARVIKAANGEFFIEVLQISAKLCSMWFACLIGNQGRSSVSSTASNQASV